MVIDSVNAHTLMPVVHDNVAREARVMTDEHSGFRDVGKFLAAYELNPTEADNASDKLARKGAPLATPKNG